jgi:thioredoxin reductase
MGIRTDNNGRVIVNDRNETSLTRTFAVDDFTPGAQNVLAAATDGATVAKKIIGDIVLATVGSDQLHFAGAIPKQAIGRIA